MSMELIYSMRRKPLKCEPPHFESPSDHEVIRPICTISNANIIAFSSPTELMDSEGDTWGGHVYVCDLDTPWDSHKVTSTSYPVSTLEWDLEGKQLLVATTTGDVSVFTQKDYLLNEWTCLYNANFSGEHIIRSIFFHHGRRVVAVEKKPDVPITERIQMLRSTPTLKGFGGAALEGALIITATGLIGALTPPSSADSIRAQVATDCLRPTRDHITTASIAHKNGSLIVAAVCRAGAARWCVVCAHCAVTAAAPSPRLALSPLPTIYLPHHNVAQTVSISWWLCEDPDSLLVSCGSLSLWKCTERSHQVHKLFSKGPLQGSSTPGGGTKPGADCFNTLVWQKAAAWALEGAGAVCGARAAPPGGAQHAAIATARALHVVARDNPHFLCSRPVITSGLGSSLAEAATTPPKKAKYGSGVASGGAGCAVASCVAMSALGGVAAVIDTHAQLHVYKLPQPWADIPTPLTVQHATSLLDYAMVSGVDCLDVIMTLKHSVVELIYERLTETFQRQPATFQQYYFHSWLKLRIALCRSVAAAQSSCSWLVCLQSAMAAWACVSAALRADDKPDSAPLAALLDEHLDHDKSLLALEAKFESAVEAAALAPLRLILQRALDIALTALLSLCQHQHQHLLHHSYEVWADGSAVQLLRRLAAAARLAGRCAEPLLRPLARLAACSTPKADLLEECCALTSSWSGARVWEALPRCAVAAPHAAAAPHYLEYGVEPESLRYNPEPPAYVQCETIPSTTMDSIRYMFLGGGARPARWRQCARCGSRALPAAQPARHPLQRASDARFLQTCRCGGKWTLFSNI